MSFNADFISREQLQKQEEMQKQMQQQQQQQAPLAPLPGAPEKLTINTDKSMS